MADNTNTTTHTTSGVSPTVQAASVTYLCDFFGSGSAQLEVSKDGGETWLSADVPVRASMEVFVEFSRRRCQCGVAAECGRDDWQHPNAPDAPELGWHPETRVPV